MKQLRPYQQKAIDGINNALERGVTKMAVILPTGTGKTFCAVQAIKDMGRILWITHTEELISQSAAALSEEVEGEIGLIKAGTFDVEHNVVMASAQTLHRRLGKMKPDDFDVIVADECDLFGAVSFNKSLDYFTPKLRLGLTATYYRNDNLQMTDIFDEVAYEYTLREAVTEGYLAKPIVIKLKTSTSLDKVHTLAGEFNTKELSNEVNTPARNYQIVNAYLEHGQGRQVISFCCDVQHAIDLCEAFNEKGVNTEYIVGDKKLTTDRKGTISRFESDETTGLTNVMVLSVGYNYQDIGVEIMACPTKSRRKYIQQLGRGFRLKTDKFLEKWTQDIIIIDVVDGTSKHKLINTDELDRDLPLEEKLFISDIDRQKLMDVKEKRKALLETANRDQDELFELFPLPKVPVYRSQRLNKPATESQLSNIKAFGYDIENISYTMAMVTEIFARQPAYQQDIDNITSAGYDTSRGMTVVEGKLAYAELIKRDNGTFKK
jgi:superfamily II DNA or RNA helicase